MPSVHILYASTTGNTEYVVEHVAAALREHSVTATIKRIEFADASDLGEGDVLVLASGSWNTGGVEGQLNPHMYSFVHAKADKSDLQRKPCAVIGLGDDRYRYTANSANHLRAFIESHNGVLIGEPLIIRNIPEGQEAAMQSWAKTLSTLMPK